MALLVASTFNKRKQLPLFLQQHANTKSFKYFQWRTFRAPLETPVPVCTQGRHSL